MINLYTCVLMSVPRGQVIQVSAVDVDQHLRRRDLAQITKRTVGGTLEMILHHMRTHLLIVETLQTAYLARVIHLRWFTGRHLQRIRFSGSSIRNSIRLINDCYIINVTLICFANKFFDDAIDRINFSFSR